MKSTREMVEELTKAGKTKSEIADELDITLSCVLWHSSEEHRKYTLKKRSENKYKFVLKMKMDRGGKCSKCGYSKCLAALHFHHRNPSEKTVYRFKSGALMNVSQMAANIGKELALKEADKCDLICANCHAEIHWSKPNEA